ncbi:MAG: quinone oxidoreductase [Phenylobacterium sp.]
MRAIRIEQAGGPEVIQVVDVPVPQPKPGQVLVRNQAIGVNFADTYNRTGLYPLKLPSGLGIEGAGVVEAIGDGVTRLAVGDSVGYVSGPSGAYAEFHVAEAGRTVKLPAGVDARLAAAAMVKGMTAEYLVRRCYPLKAGEWALVHAAAGGTGQILVQWARHIGARVIATVGSPDKAAIARRLGAEEVILYREQDVAAEVKRITGGAGVAVAYDSVGASTFEGTLASLARRGVFVSFGNASGPPPAVEPLRLQRAGSVYLTRPTMADYVRTTEELDDSAGALFQLIGQGVIKIAIGQEFPLAEARRAHEALESRSTTGSILLIP